MNLRLAYLSVWLLGASSALAREPGPLDLSRVPLEAETPEKFIPPGWKLEESARGDLNGDGRADMVLSLVEALTPEQQVDDAGTRTLLVLLSQPEKWRRAGASNQVLGCFDCTGTYAGEGGMVRIDQGVIVLTQLIADAHREVVLRFRHDAGDGRFVFLGDEIQGDAPGKDQTLTVSTFPLQGRKVTETSRYDGRRNKKVLSTRKAKIPVSRRYLEEVAIEKYF